MMLFTSGYAAPALNRYSTTSGRYSEAEFIRKTLLRSLDHMDSPAMPGRPTAFIALDPGPEVPWHLVPFLPEISWKMQDTPATKTSQLETAGTIGQNAGLSYIYSGSARDDGGKCPFCKALSPIKD